MAEQAGRKDAQRPFGAAVVDATQASSRKCCSRRSARRSSRRRTCWPPSALPGGASTAPAEDVLEADTQPDSGFDMERHVREIERQYVTEPCAAPTASKGKAAKLLGMSVRSFRSYARKYGLRSGFGGTMQSHGCGSDQMPREAGA